MHSLTALEFIRDVSAAKRAADRGPVVISNRGEPAYVLLSIDEYRRLRGSAVSLVERLSMDDDIEFEPAPIDLRPPDL